MATMLDETKFVKRFDDFKIAATGGIADITLMDIVGDYEAQVARKMTALTPEELEGRFKDGSEPFYTTLKYDGEGTYIFYDADLTPVAFRAASGRARIGFHALEEITKRLKQKKVKKALLRAEFYLPPTEDEPRPTAADVTHITFGGSKAEVEQLKFAMLDVLMYEGQDHRPEQKPFSENWELLGQLFGDDDSAPFHRARGGLMSGKEIVDFAQKCIQDGHEGIVLRKRDRPELFKVKPRLTVDAVVLGFVEDQLESGFGVASLLTGLTYPKEIAAKVGSSKAKGKGNGNGSGGHLIQTLARVGSGLNDEERTGLLETLTARKVKNPVMLSDSSGRLIQFVKPELLVETSGEDLIQHKSTEKPHRTQTFDWNAKAGEYQFKGLTECPRLTFATFSKLRPDKDLAEGGARLEQIIHSPSRPAFQELAENAPTKITRREVYRKGGAIRKLVVVYRSIPSNDSKGDSPDIIPYTLYWTDFSARRKEPLKISTSFAFTEDRAKDLAEAMLEDGLAKGWEKVA